jgi:uncharacterized protein YpmB
MKKNNLILVGGIAIIVLVLIVGVLFLSQQPVNSNSPSEPSSKTVPPSTSTKVVAELCNQINSEMNKANKKLLFCTLNDESIYVIETVIGEGREFAYYDFNGKFIENAVLSDAPDFITNSGKQTYCITDSGNECPHLNYNCSKITCPSNDVHA